MSIIFEVTYKKHNISIETINAKNHYRHPIQMYRMQFHGLVILCPPCRSTGSVLSKSGSPWKSDTTFPELISPLYITDWILSTLIRVAARIISYVCKIAVPWDKYYLPGSTFVRVWEILIARRKNCARSAKIFGVWAVLQGESCHFP